MPIHNKIGFVMNAFQFLFLFLQLNSDEYTGVFMLISLGFAALAMMCHSYRFLKIFSEYEPPQQQTPQQDLNDINEGPW